MSIHPVYAEHKGPMNTNHNYLEAYNTYIESELKRNTEKKEKTELEKFRTFGGGFTITMCNTKAHANDAT